MSKGTIERLANGARSLDRAYSEMLQQSQFWTPEALQTYQRGRLTSLLRFCQTRVPFYASRLAPVLRVDGTIDWERWSEIQPVRREDLLHRHAEMVSPTLPKAHGATHDFSTSGSTGLPATITVSRLANMVTHCCGLRAQLWHGMDWSKTAMSWTGERADAAWPHGVSLGPWGPHWSPNATGEMLFLTRSTPPDQVLEFARRRGVSYIFSRPRSLQGLALDALHRGDLFPLDQGVCFGAARSEAETTDWFNAFGAQMWGSYSSKEAGMMAHDCPSGPGMHINGEAVLLEIVDADDRPVPTGTPGRVLVTPLHNFAQPLIRYDQGDLGVMGEACACGRCLPVLSRIVGRQTDLFRFPDGQILAPTVPDDLRGFLGAQYWQLVQIGPLAVEVRYVPFAGTTADERAAADLVVRHLRPDVTVAFSRHETLERLDGGKFKQYAYEAPRDSAF